MTQKMSRSPQNKEPSEQDGSSAATEKTSGSSQNNDSSNSTAGGHEEMGGGGGNFIAGVFLQAVKKKMSIYEAMVRGLLTPGTALVLLEAQAASGSLTDPVRNRRLSVDEALGEGLIGRDFFEKLLSAEGAVRGYAEPYTGRRISLFQAMKNELIVKEHGVRLLEAQIATGGIVDPVHGHRIPVQVAHERGYLDEEMSRFLSNPKSQARSCFDPNTQENVTYRQLLRRCLPDPETGLMMLHVMDKSSALFQLSKDARKALQATLGEGTFQGQSVSLWELLFSRYVPDQQREELLRRYKAGTVTIPEMIFSLTTFIAGAEGENESLSSSRDRPDDEVEASQQLHDVEASQAVQETPSSRVTTNHEVETSQLLHDLPSQEFSSRVTTNHEVETSQLLHDLASQEFSSRVTTNHEVETSQLLHDLASQELSSTLTTNHEVEASQPAQATHSEEQQLRRSLKSSIIYITAGELRGQRISLLDLLFSKYVPQEKRQGLLELYRAGILSTELVATVVTTILNGTGGGEATFVVNTRSPHRAVARAEESGDEFLDQLDDVLRSTRITLPAEEMQGRQVRLWDLLFSNYIPEEKGQEILELYHERLLTLEQMINVVSNVVKKKESTGRRFLIAVKASEKDTEPAMGEKNVGSHKEESVERTLKTTVVNVEVGEFQGCEVSVWDLLFSNSISEEKRQELLELYKAGTLPLERLVTVVTTLVEKKESTGRRFLIAVKASEKDTEPAMGEKNAGSHKEESVERTLKTTVVNVEVGEFRGREVSVWDLLHSKFIPKENREELLELYQAGELTLEQVKTVVSTVVSKAEAARREEPRGARSPGGELGVAGAGNDHLQEDGSWEETLKSTRVEVPVGEFQGRKVSVWDLLFSNSISEEKRQELLELYKAGTLPLERLVTVVTTLVEKKESTGRRFLIAVKASEKDTEPAMGEKNVGSHKEESVERTLKTTVVNVEVGEFRGREVSVWDLLHSKFIPKENREELLELYQAGELTLEQVKTVVSTIVSKAEAARREEPRGARSPGGELGVAGAGNDHLQEDGSWEETLNSTRVEVPVGEFQGRRVSVWDLLFSNSISEEKRQELLELYKAGTLPLERLVTVVTTLVEKKESTGRRFLIAVKASEKDTEPAMGEKNAGSHKEESVERTLKTTVVNVEVGEFRGREVSVWDLLHSKFIPKENREELLELYQAGELTLEQVKTVVSTIVSKAEAARREEPRGARSPGGELGVAGAGNDHLQEDGSWEETLKSTRVEVPVGEFQGRKVSVWDLLFSNSISEEKRQELLELYKAGTLPLERLVTVVTTLVEKKESTGRRFLIAVKASEKDTEPAMGEKNVGSHKEESVERTLKTTVVNVEVGEFRGREVSVWDLLHSKFIPKENREELLELYQAGELTLEQVKTVVSTIVSKAEAARREEPRGARSPGGELGVAGAGNDHLQEDGSWEETLNSTRVEVPVGEFQGRRVSVWDLLFSNSISEEKRQELLELYKAGTLPLERLVTVVTTLVEKKESTGRRFLIAVKASEKDTEPAMGEKNAGSHKEESVERTLKTTVVNVEVGEFRGREVSVWDLLHSKFIPKENREELLELYQAGELTLEQVKTVVSTVVSKAEAARREEPRGARSPGGELGVAGAGNDHLQEDGSWEETLNSTRVGTAMDEFHKVSVWDLLFSRSVSEEERQELLHRYHAGTLTVEELVNTTSSISRAEQGRHLPPLPQQTMDLLQLEGSYLTFGRFQEQRVSVWELLSTQQVSEYRREAQLDSYGTGGLRVNTVTVTTTVVTGPRREERHRQDQ